MDGQLILHEDARSGNCYKIRLVAAHLDVPLVRRNHDILKGDTRTLGFLTSVNANGRIPVLQIGDRFLAESNAACFWLADGSHLVPPDRFARADMLHWMFWEQYSHEPNIATLKFWRLFIGEASLNEVQRMQIPIKQAAGEQALALMDKHLRGQIWLAAGAFSLADICLYAYTHTAAAGGFDLAGYPSLRRWLAAVAAQPGHIPMQS